MNPWLIRIRPTLKNENNDTLCVRLLDSRAVSMKGKGLFSRGLGTVKEGIILFMIQNPMLPKNLKHCISVLFE